MPTKIENLKNSKTRNPELPLAHPQSTTTIPKVP